MGSTGYHEPPPDWAQPERTHRHYDPSDKTTLPGVIDGVKVVGMSFHPGYPHLLYLLNTEGCAGLVLVREPDNAHDPNAVAVSLVDATDGPIGHLPAALSARIAPEIDAGAEWSVDSWEVLIAEGHESNPGLTVSLRRSSGG